ncbi:MAG: NAD(P)H-dependent oxidoreductase [Culicoidibacterales bacterium]
MTALEFDETAQSATLLWNLGVLAIVKAYSDYVIAAGVTFAYTVQKPVGLLKNKKAVHIAVRGGLHSEGRAADFEMGDCYLTSVYMITQHSQLMDLTLMVTATKSLPM